MPDSDPLPPSGRIVIPVAHGGLEAILREPAAPIAAAVVCHPHPLGGGTMNNNVVYRTAKVLVEAGIAALRFNFRGVGASSGSHADGLGEEDDVRAALATLRARHPALPLWVAGFSFGARVGLAVGAEDPQAASLDLLLPPDERRVGRTLWGCLQWDRLWVRPERGLSGAHSGRSLRLPFACGRALSSHWRRARVR